MNFADAIQALRFANLPVAREGWNGKGMFIYAVPAAAYPAQTGVAKAHFGSDAKVPYGAYIAIRGADGVVNPWQPSQQDMFADDWVIVEVDGVVRPYTEGN